MKNRWIKLGIVLVGAALIIATALSAMCSKNTEDKVFYSNGIAIRDIYVSDRELTAINTTEANSFVVFYNYYQPFLDNDEGIYYYSTVVGDSAKDQLCYNSQADGATELDVPLSSIFSATAIIDGVIYGIEYEENESAPGGNIIVSYTNGQRKKLCDKYISTCFFAEDGIYFQTDNSIYIMDYSGRDLQLILEIPVELYYEDELSKIVVYEDKLWYCYDDTFRDFAFPLWCYDFNGNILRFSRGGIDKINNGFFYFSVTDEEYRNILYRFDTETYEIEMVINSPYIGDYAFYDDHIIFITYDDVIESEVLYKMNLHICEPFIYSSQLGSSEFLLQTSACADRLFVTGGAGMFYTYLAEIDLEGNIISIIHEDDLEWYFSE